MSFLSLNIITLPLFGHILNACQVSIIWLSSTSTPPHYYQCLHEIVQSFTLRFWTAGLHIWFSREQKTANLASFWRKHTIIQNLWFNELHYLPRYCIGSLTHFICRKGHSFEKAFWGNEYIVWKSWLLISWVCFYFYLIEICFLFCISVFLNNFLINFVFLCVSSTHLELAISLHPHFFFGLFTTRFSRFIILAFHI